MKVAVTGASGFIGRTLTDALRAQGHDARALKDVADLAGVEALVHLAGVADPRSPQRDLQRFNVDLAARAGRTAAAAGVRMIFMSSAKVHGEHSSTVLSEASPLVPRTPYALSKARAEEALREIPDLSLTVLRPPLVYGAAVRGTFLVLMRVLARGIPLPLAGIENRRSFVYVENLAHAVMATLNGPTGTYLVSDDGALSSTALCTMLGRELGRPARLFAAPAVLHGLIPRALTSSMVLDDRLVRLTLDWKPPYSVEEGLRRTARWYHSR
jgi:nucleoside-diphosphate-sugar epimerase